MLLIPATVLCGGHARRSGYGCSRTRQRLLVATSSQRDTVADTDDRSSGDVVSLARRRVQQQQLQQSSVNNPTALADFVRKLRAAWEIFFPERPRPLTPKDEGKRRLRMILVADRCGMSQESLQDMRQNIVRVVADYVDIEAEDLVEVNLSVDPELGTIYSVAVPVKRVKPQARVPLDQEADPDGIVLQWDPNDMESDPSGQFPYGA
ncbi:hypothetical protein N2152v2_000699 [Parachlorella kessleri]